MTHMRKSPLERGIAGVLAVAVVFLFLAPFYIAVANSFKTPLETAENVLALPKSLSLDNYRDAMSKISFAKSLVNTLTVTAAGVVLIVLCSSLSGHAIARNSGKHPTLRCWTGCSSRRSWFLSR